MFWNVAIGTWRNHCCRVGDVLLRRPPPELPACWSDPAGRNACSVVCSACRDNSLSFARASYCGIGLHMARGPRLQAPLTQLSHLHGPSETTYGPVRAVQPQDFRPSTCRDEARRTDSKVSEVSDRLRNGIGCPTERRKFNRCLQRLLYNGRVSTCRQAAPESPPANRHPTVVAVPARTRRDLERQRSLSNVSGTQQPR